MAESERFDEGITSWDIPSELMTWIHGDIGSSSFSQVITGGGSPCRYIQNQYQIRVWGMSYGIYAMFGVGDMKQKMHELAWKDYLEDLYQAERTKYIYTSFQVHPYLITNFDTCRISCSDNNEVLWVFKTRSHWMGNTQKQKMQHDLDKKVKSLICAASKVSHLLLGFFAHTIAEGGLTSPAPDSLIAETLNSYSAPSVTSLTANFTSEIRMNKQS